MASRKHKIGCCVTNAYPKVGGGWGPRREIYRNSETIFVTSKSGFCITRLGFGSAQLRNGGGGGETGHGHS